MSIDVIRISAALMIFLCHACNESGSALGNVLGQVFNVGVPIFFLLSGYLHSQKKSSQSIWCWYGRKLKRLLIPLYLFLFGLALIYVFTVHRIVFGVWLHSIIPICGVTQQYISGCGHLWFITHLLLCYLITPLLQRHNISSSSRAVMMGLPAVWLVTAFAIAYTLPPIWCTLLNSLFTYAVGFYILPSLLTRRMHIALPVVAAVVAGGFRVITRALWDGTPFYNSIATAISHIILACAIILFIRAIVEKIIPDLPPPQGELSLD